MRIRDRHARGWRTIKKLFRELKRANAFRAWARRGRSTSKCENVDLIIVRIERDILACLADVKETRQSQFTQNGTSGWHDVRYGIFRANDLRGERKLYETTCSTIANRAGAIKAMDRGIENQLTAGTKNLKGLVPVETCPWRGRI